MKQTTKEYCLLFLGCLLYSVGTSIFLIPANIGSGGATGIALCFNSLFKFPVGLTIIFVNLPLFIFGYKLLGKNFAFKSALIVFLSSIFIDYLNLILIPFNLKSIMSQDVMLSSIFCGITIGIGIALIFMAGGSTGGFDISAKIINNKFPSLSISNILLIQDILIYLFIAIVLGPRSVMYALIMSFVRTKSIDTLQEGISSSKQCMIICESPEEIISEIQSKLLRGITIIDAVGAYSNGNKKIIYVVIQNNQLSKLKKIVKHTDPNAFVTVSSVSDILGNYRQSSMSI
ncbi:YitT family protein [Clostridium ganghwense]|uniref:YitT family protein n=1 Tax=Clostridium ganghwense TaxID=312089 RepID=A0ABT4CPG5_9CLOT|nr:YitT family protein [Clostridium ganghwense]MCY6370944.1 YitT family protein [Clostridium ganghwense]